jgi:hypothetical protein
MFRDFDKNMLPNSRISFGLSHAVAFSVTRVLPIKQLPDGLKSLTDFIVQFHFQIPFYRVALKILPIKVVKIISYISNDRLLARRLDPAVGIARNKNRYVIRDNYRHLTVLMSLTWMTIIFSIMDFHG